MLILSSQVVCKARLSVQFTLIIVKKCQSQSLGNFSCNLFLTCNFFKLPRRVKIYLTPE